jgi:hypothetical protein
MLQTIDELNRKALAWLEQFSQELDADPDVIDAMPIEDVKAELRALGVDVEGFHTRLARTLNLAKVKNAVAQMIKWVSPVWRPQWAGQFVGAGDIPEQKHTFRMEKGAIEVMCSWKPQAGDTPPYLEVSWKADTVIEGNFWCRFVHPDTNAMLAEVPLGTYKEGGKYFTRKTLGFDPSKEPWAIAIVLKEREA